MRFAATGRFVFVAQWPAAVLLPLFFLFGRVLVGSELGFMVVVGIVFVPLAIGLLITPPVLTLFDLESRRVRATRLAYDIATFVLWGACLLAALSVEDSLGFVDVSSALSAWGASSDDSEAVFAAAVAIIGVSYFGAVVLGIMGIVRGRARETTDAVTPA